MFPQVLTIAGSDGGGGAGIQADLKTFQMRQVFATSVITAITAQNTLGVHDIHPIPLQSIVRQIKAVADDFHIKAFKIGMLGTADVIECVAENIKQHHFGFMVLDPVMVAKGGAPLLQKNAIHALTTQLIPLADVITPNLPETEVLTGMVVENANTAQQAAQILQQMGAKNVVIKGGHLSENHCIDWVFLKNQAPFELFSQRIHTPHTHGTGCTFSACITAELAKGADLNTAIRTAKSFITQAIASPLNIGAGHGPVNHWAFDGNQHHV